MKATVKDEKSRSDGRWRHFTVCSLGKLCEQEAQTIQKSHGYDIMGYGFSGFKSVYDDDMKCFKTTWRCYDSCD